MIIIKRPDTLIDAMLEKKYVEKYNYTTSKFLVFLKYQETNLVFSTLTNGLYSLTDEEIISLKQPENCDISLKKELIKNFLIFPSHIDEFNLSRQFKNIGNIFSNKEEYINSYTILTTTDCNARCYYCYEYGIERVHMSIETSSDVAKYIISNSCGKKVSLKWFGGEPLYNYPVIDNITDILRENNIEYESQITTNAYLFNSELVKRAIEKWNLVKAQVTLDGTEEIYNKYKAYINTDCDSPFVKVINNIELLIKAGVTVNIRLNMDENNADDLYNLVTWLSEKFPSDSNLHVYAAVIFTKDYYETLENHEKLLGNYTKLCELIGEKRLSRYRLIESPLSTTTCMANNPHTVVITPKGDLQRCEHISDDEIYGNIWSGEINKDIYDSWFVIHDEIEECKTCAFYPNCKFLKKCKTFLCCTEDDRLGKKLHHFDAMRWEYDQYLKKLEKK